MTKLLIINSISIFLAFTAARSADLPPQLFPNNTSIVFQGDSITHGGRGGDPNHEIGHSYVILIAAPQAAYYPDAHFHFYNRGVSGNTSGAVLGRWKNETLALKPDIVSLLVGVNDVFFTTGKGQPFSVSDYEKNYRAMLDQSRQAYPNVKFMLLDPFIMPGKNTSPNWDAWRKSIGEEQAVVEKLAVEYHAPVVHLQKMFQGVAAAHPPIEYWVWDGVHPTFPGHQLVADEWVRVYKEFYGTAANPK